MSWRAWFFVSAALNILVLGAAAGFLFGGGFHRGEQRELGAGLLAPRAVMAALPPEVRVELRRDLARAWVGARAERAAYRAAVADTQRQLEAEPYDAAAMEAALTRQRRASSALVGRFHEAIADSVEQFSPEQRQAIAAALRGLRARAEEGAVIEEEMAPRESEAGEAPRREQLRERLRERLRARREN